MSNWKIRFLGILLLGAGGYLFVFAVRDLSSEWPQIFVGLLSIFSAAMGFGFLIMPLEPAGDPSSSSKDDPPIP
ncbi:MAG: hypothetical protein GWM98_22880 [Nitrospinaceae bacterium]|nr:hypothetical protein [Nitrospinaceae bacterium]NIR56780.1 hypothetical protein [Nitrospinaceae bacterium]NIS87234.1 hypothetical protein [Nitrospinaceae bacterium]NIT84101.1 hypothetical protein [Nitrospinaceae bacterium]NIU46287.1 hypothetical protein [Nitrospinaceae bacterium]